jgi:hypothetical protein
MYKINLAKQALINNVPKRAFSSVRPPVSNGNKVAFGLSALGICGLTALCYQGH